MSGNDLAAAVTVLLAAGVALINWGLDMVRLGDTYGGITVIIFGVALIFAAVLVTKLMIQTVTRRTLKKFTG